MTTVLAAHWSTAATTLNNLILSCNNVINTYGAVITPAIALLPGINYCSGPVLAGDIVTAAIMNGTDKLITQFNYMRTYDSCRVYTSSATWVYGCTVRANELTGRRDASFPAGEAYITPPVAGNIMYNLPSGRNILQAIINSCSIHSSTIFPGAGNEYVVINNCHSSCHQSCHQQCHDRCQTCQCAGF